MRDFAQSDLETGSIRMLAKLRIDPFTVALLIAIAIASLLPVSGTAARVMDGVTDAAIAALFFLHGARLSRAAILSGVAHWRLHLLIFAATFVLFPLLGWAWRPLLQHWLTPELVVGVLFLCALPSTVQSSIAFTSLAGGNVPAAVCSASASSLFGVIITPLLLAWMLEAQGAIEQPLHAVGRIMLQLLLPFVAGHLLRPWIGAWVDRQRGLLRFTDQGTILLVVYTAFSASVIDGLWKQTPVRDLFVVLVISSVLLALVMPLLAFTARRLGFARADEITIVFCGSKKSLATGVPMARILFAGGSLGAIVLPLMVFHQLQLLVSAQVAQRYARKRD